MDPFDPSNNIDLIWENNLIEPIKDARISNLEERINICKPLTKKLSWWDRHGQWFYYFWVIWSLSFLVLDLLLHKWFSAVLMIVCLVINTFSYRLFKSSRHKRINIRTDWLDRQKGLEETLRNIDPGNKLVSQNVIEEEP